MEKKVTLAVVEAALETEREKRWAQEPLLSVGVKSASDEELERALENTRLALKSGRRQGRDALQALDQEQAIVEELLERQVPTLEQALGLAPSKSKMWRKYDWTVDELYDADFPEPKWIVPELLPTGLASLAGRPKLGKSWLALQLSAAVASGGRFLDWAVERGEVLFIALEDPPRRLRERLECLRVARRTPIQFYTDWLPLNAEAGGLQDLQRCVAESRPRLVVIDTLARAFSSRIEWNSVSEATAALAVLQRLAHDHDCCLLTVDHHKKPGALPDVIDDILGSTGKAAVIDTAWGLYKERGKKGATLKVTGRDIDPREMAIEFHPATSCWQSIGDAQARTAAEQEVYELLQEMGEADAGSLARQLGKHRTTVRKTLKRLQSQGHVESKLVPATKTGGKRILFYIREDDDTEVTEATEATE